MASNDELLNAMNTVPALLSDLALSVAAAQQRLDEDYIRNLKEYLLLVANVHSSAAAAGVPDTELLELLRSTAPVRHQLTETTVEVRADLQMSTMSEIGVSGSLGLRTGLFAVTVNAAYTRRNAYDHRAAATIRSVIHAVPPNPGVMEKLLSAASASPIAELPPSAQYKEFAGAFGEMLKLLPGAQRNDVAPVKLPAAVPDAAPTQPTASNTSTTPAPEPPAPEPTNGNQ